MYILEDFLIPDLQGTLCPRKVLMNRPASVTLYVYGRAGYRGGF